ncbi:hypothetical protein MMC25_001201 [Agyrium rufum]|nr:hypothetical protein [Agyrium rufum]
MQTTIFTAAALTLLASMTNAFLLTDLSTGQVTNFGDNDCQIWTGQTFSFQSNAGCTLVLWSQGNCEGSTFTVTTQETTQTAPFPPISAICYSGN